MDCSIRIEQCDGNEIGLIRRRLSDKWSVPVVSVLRDQSRRFNELRREVKGISQHVLTRTLRSLERDGLVSREVTPTLPPRVDYSLTPLGQEFLAQVDTITDWVQDNLDTFEDAQRRYDRSN